LGVAAADPIRRRHFSRFPGQTSPGSGTSKETLTMPAVAVLYDEDLIDDSEGVSLTDVSDRRSYKRASMRPMPASSSRTTTWAYSTARSVSPAESFSSLSVTRARLRSPAVSTSRMRRPL